ncbi:hypothetical protein DEU56DRAFT_324469 [Suillus clintonianus]|uniref:uncharacterized protein n=1 Tax=Suillus clintonianus TaxID=1904413 RepID=UPI001B8739FC|nr:uncharacterized protein DEU56DRAFT_324469 [Suillus clintonianus]KAG2139250.1 hypothetical protein DEU56DRAFT_324469 [Suillus clintonianus]
MMVLKRPLDAYENSASASRGPKRRQLSSLPPSSPFTSTSSLRATPRTPCSIRNWKVPSDSPTNPFGRIRRLTTSTTLPRPSSYGKHLPLRFQLIRPDGDGRSHANKDGVYRVVQVPLTYTLGHLRKLIKFVFQPAKESEMGGSYHFRRAARHASIPWYARHPSSYKGKEPALDFDLEPGHLFEVQKDIEISRSGEIIRGMTTVKSSTLRDPYHYPGNGSEGSLLDAEDGEDDVWRWEAEEDFQLSQLWAPGGDIKKGIIYHHDSTTQIHITMNTKKIPGRKGVGNKPYLFMAWGSIDLFAPPSAASSIILTGIELTRWNNILAFEKFLKAEEEQERLKRGGDEEELLGLDAEGEVDPDISSLTLPMCSSIDFSSPSSLSSSIFSLTYSSSASSAITPFPASPSRKRRVDYANKRMCELTKKVRKTPNPDYDDEKKEEEFDELDELDDDEDPAAAEKPSDWDPFGSDESEI